MAKVEVECLTCSKFFLKDSVELKKHPRSFCSRSCAAKTNNLGIRRHPPRTCKKCKEQYITTKEHRSLTFCKNCKLNHFNSDIAKTLSLDDYRNRDSVKNKHPSWISSHVRLFNRSWNKPLIELPCQKCGYSLHTELCHIKPISKFDGNTTLGEINDPSNILVLCPNHHWEFDNGKLELKDIPSREILYPADLE